jgi:hypothetical protein
MRANCRREAALAALTIQNRITALDLDGFTPLAKAEAGSIVRIRSVPREIDAMEPCFGVLPLLRIFHANLLSMNGFLLSRE